MLTIVRAVAVSFTFPTLMGCSRSPRRDSAPGCPRLKAVSQCGRLADVPVATQFVTTSCLGATRRVASAVVFCRGWRVPLCLFALTLALNAQAATNHVPARVLVLHSFGREFEPDETVAEAFMAELVRLCSRPVEFLQASPGRSQFGAGETDAPLLEYLAARSGPQEPDLLVPIGAPALAFVCRNRAELYPDTPVLSLMTEASHFSEAPVGAPVVSVGCDINVPRLMDNILQLLPETRLVCVAIGAGPMERAWEAEMRNAWKPFEERLQIDWMGGLSVEQMQERVSGLPPRSVVIVAPVFRDVAGKAYEREQALMELYRTSNAPIFGYSEAQLGLGIVGGPLLPLRQTGGVGPVDGFKAAPNSVNGHFKELPMDRLLNSFVIDSGHRWLEVSAHGSLARVDLAVVGVGDIGGVAWKILTPGIAVFVGSAEQILSRNLGSNHDVSPFKSWVT